MGVTIEKAALDKKLVDLKSLMTPMGFDGFFTLLAGPIHQFLQSQARELFDTEGKSGPAGKWAPLTPATEEYRRRAGYRPDGPINVRTGDLKSMMTQEAPGILSVGNSLILNFPGDAQSVGRRPIKMAQAEGTLVTKSGKKSTPRPVVQVGVEDVAQIMFLANQFFTTPLRGRG